MSNNTEAARHLKMAVLIRKNAVVVALSRHRRELAVIFHCNFLELNEVLQVTC